MEEPVDAKPDHTEEDSASTASPEHEEDTKLTYGSGAAYWNRRFAENAADGNTFDWLFDYKSLRPLLREYVPTTADVLQIGCGNSTIAVEWCDDGHTGGFVNVDNSAYVIEQLRSEQGQFQSNLRYVLDDVRCLNESDFPCESFDVVFDKATFDCVICNPDNQKDSEDMLRSIFRVLRPGGFYLLLSCGDPESRLCWLEDDGLEWSVSARHTAIRSRSDTDACNGGSKPPWNRPDVFSSEEVLLTNNDDWETHFGELAEDEHTFLYVCRKLSPADRPRGSS